MAIDSVGSSSSSNLNSQPTTKKNVNVKDTGFGTSAAELNPDNTRDGSLTADSARLNTGRLMKESISQTEKSEPQEPKEDVNVIA